MHRNTTRRRRRCKYCSGEGFSYAVQDPIVVLNKPVRVLCKKCQGRGYLWGDRA